MTPSFNIFIHGWYGAGNVGDELLLTAFSQWAAECGATVSVASVNPAHTRRTHGLDAVHARDLASVARSMAASDLFVLGGGGLFQTHHAFTVPGLYSFASGDIASYARPALMARQMGVPYMLWGQGIGPLDGKGARDIVRDVASQAYAISLRDDVSAALLRELGVSTEASVGPDPVWAMSLDPVYAADSSRPKQRRLGVVVRPWEGPDWEAPFLAALREEVDPIATTLVWMAFQAGAGFESDAPVIDRLQAALPQFTHETRQIERPELAVPELHACDALICMRLHAQILALRLRRPVLCLEYDEKMSVTSQLAGLTESSRLALDAEPEQWRSRVRQLVSGHVPLVSVDRLAELADQAQVHRAVIHSAIASLRRAPPGRQWRGGDFDWIGAWSSDHLQHLLAEREGRLAALREHSARQAAENAELRQALVVEREALAVARSEIEQSRATLARSEERLRELDTVRDELSVTQAAHALAIDEVSGLQQRIRSLETRIANETAATHALEAETATLREARDALTSDLASLRVDAAAEAHARRVAERDVARLTHELQAVETSTSWRLTHPLRIARGLVVLRGDERRALARAALGSLFWSMPRPLRGMLDPLRRGLSARRQRLAASATTPVAFDWLALANAAERLAIVPSAFEFDELVNQRPINLAKYLAGRGYQVVFAAWQWSRGEALQRSNREVYPGVVQIDLFDLLDRLGGLAARADAHSLYFITLPAPQLVELHSVARARGLGVVYDILDDWHGFHAVGQAPWYDAGYEAEAVLAADAVAAVSPALAQRFASLRGDIAVVGNGHTPATLGLEQRGCARAARPAGPRPRIGYFGHLTEAWFDWTVVLDAAARLPDHDFELIGYGEPEWVRVAATRLGNVRLPGKVKPSELWRFASQWHVALAPFQPGPLAEAIDPIKVYEYLYFGLPVVCTGIPHLAEYPDVRVVDGPEAFASACADLARREPDAAGVDAFLEATTWQARFDRLLELSSHGGLRSLYVR